jgi:hypothetical protein
MVIGCNNFMTEFEFLLIVVACGVTYLLSHFNASRKVQKVLDDLHEILADNVVTKDELEKIIKTLTAKQ